MSISKIDLLRVQISKVIPMLEQQYQDNPSKMMELILRRYKKADEILAVEELSLNDINKIGIAGSVRAYLDSASDYRNPILEEMGIAEKLLTETIYEMRNDSVLR